MFGFDIGKCYKITNNYYPQYPYCYYKYVGTDEYDCFVFERVDPSDLRKKMIVYKWMIENSNVIIDNYHIK